MKFYKIQYKKSSTTFALTYRPVGMVAPGT
jgi:hypothetical protein